MTEAAELVGSCLYQLNLTLWMLQPPSGATVEPILHQAGFRLHGIETELHLPLELANMLKADEIAISDPAAPDVILDSSTQDFVIVECKRTMFGAEPNQGDDPIRQARALMLMVPTVLDSALLVPPTHVRETYLLYLTRHQMPHPHTKGLREIARQLRDAGYPTTPLGAVGLEATSDAIVLHGRYPESTLPPALDARLGDTPVRVQQLDEGTDPRPLYYIPWTPGADDQDDDYSQAAFGNRILSAAALVIGPKIPPCEVQLDVEDLLREATFGYYNQWRNHIVRKRLRDSAKRLVKSQVKQGAPELALQPLGNPSRGWTFSLSDAPTQNRIIEALRKWRTERWNTPIIQRDFLDDLDGMV